MRGEGRSDTLSAILLRQHNNDNKNSSLVDQLNH